MRDYGKVSSQFWTGKTGKSLRGNAETQLLALYLVTSPHANMIGVYHCPIMYMAHETGMTIEGASKALQSLIEAGFCTFDEDDEVIWVHEMAAHQIGLGLSPKDKRVKGVQKQFANISQSLIRRGFWERYREEFHLGNLGQKASPLEAPSKPLASQEQEQEQEQEQNTHTPSKILTAPPEQAASVCVEPPDFAENSADPPLAKPEESPDFPYGNPKPAGKLAKLLRGMGVQVTPHNPDFCQWVERGLDAEEATAGVEIARAAKPKPEQIPWGYLAKILQNQRRAPPGFIPAKQAQSTPWEMAI